MTDQKDVSAQHPSGNALADKVERVARMMRKLLADLPFCDPDIKDLEQAAAALRIPAASDDVASAQHDMIQQLHAELEQLKYGIAAVSFAMGWTDVCGKTNEEFARDLRRERDRAVSQVEKLTAQNEELKAADRDHLAAKNGMESRLTAEINNLRQWKDAVLGCCKACDGFDTIQWGGEKDGWGFVMFFISHLNTRALSHPSTVGSPEGGR
jgi:hypothetical protein